jgi:uncharacterized protein YdhG (YjbR/CyaY superfamily)
MPSRPTAATIDAYIADFPPDVQESLQTLRALIRNVAPEATETISYAIPTFDLNGTHLVHFAGFAHHIGLYPTGDGIDAFKSELSAYKSGRGSVRFPLGEPLPLDLIRSIVEHRVARVTERPARSHGHNAAGED